MFFSTDLLSLKANSGLGVVWLAGTLGQRSQARRILRRDYQSVDITNACSYLMAPPEPLSLRLSASLMVGVVRVYGQQCNFCYGDATALYGKLEQSLLEIPVGGKNEKSVNLDMPMQRARHDAITINGNGNQDVISSGNVWSELDKYRVVLEKTPEVERGRQLSSAGAKSDSTNSAIPGRIASTPLQFGAGDEGLLKELFGDLADLNNLQTPNSEDALLSGVFHAASHPGSLLDVPETITVNTVRPKRKPQVDLFDEITILSREEMFQEPLLQGPFNRYKVIVVIV